MDESKKLSPSLVLNINGQPREIFCSFALLNQITNLLGGLEGVEHIAVVMLDPVTRDLVLKEVLAERSKGGAIIKPIADIGEVEISLDDVQTLLEWVSEHVMDFTLGVLEKSTAFQFRHQARLLKMVPQPSPATSTGQSA